VFERFTETARKSVFFARYEASAAGTLQIEGPHLLLGILRSDETLARLFGPPTGSSGFGSESSKDRRSRQTFPSPPIFR
jgi:hypothetical protein